MKNKVRTKIKTMAEIKRDYKILTSQYKALKSFYDDLMYLSGWGNANLGYTKILGLIINMKYNFQELTAKHEVVNRTLRQYIVSQEQQVKFLKEIEQK